MQKISGLVLPSSPRMARRREELRTFHKEEQDLFLGKTIDEKYTISSKIGWGGTSEVYLASVANNGKAAFKIASKRLDLGLMNWFIENEIEVLGRLSSNGIIKKIDSGQLEGRKYVVVEYLEGETLFSVLNSGRRLSWERSREILSQLCNALEELHSLGIVHRDVKPGNIFLYTESRKDMKLLDLGLAKVPDKPDFNPEPCGIGTPGYMAPEIIGGNAFDQRSDIYSVGVLMYKMVCGVSPFIGKTLDLMKMHLKDVPMTPRELLPHLRVPMKINDMIMKSLEKKPEDRFESITQIRDILRDCNDWPTETAIMDGTRWSTVNKLYNHV